MAKGRVQVDMQADEAKLWGAFVKVAKGAQLFEKNLTKVTKESKEAAKAEAALERAAKRVSEETRTPQERHIRRMRELNQMLARGKITQDTYGRAVRKTSEQYKRAEEAARRTTQATQQTGEAGRRAFGPQALSMLTRFAGALGLTGGIAGGVMLVRREYEALIATQERAKEATITLADAQIKFRRNLGAINQKEREEADREAANISRATGVSQRDVYMRLSTAISARGPLPKQAAFDAVRLSAMLVPESAEEGRAVAGAALDLAKATGVANVRANVGLLMGIGEAARVTDIAKISETVAPAITTGVMRGGKARETGALWAAITGGAADPTGRRSMTGTIGLVEQLAAFLPEKTTYKWVEDKAAGGMKREIERKGTGLRSGRERILALQQDAMLREQFLGQATFEKRTGGTIEQILSGKGKAAEAYATFLQRIPGIEQGEEIYKTKLKQIRGGPLQKTAEFERSMIALVEKLETADTPGARSAVMREKLIPALQTAGLGWMSSKLAGMEFELGAAGYDPTIRIFERQRRKLLEPRPGPFDSGLNVPWIAKPEPTEVDLRQAAILGEVLGVLRNMRDFQERENNVNQQTLVQPDADR